MGMATNLTGKAFHHPFTPYRIQEEFMETVYRVLEDGGGQVGILESPTGTVCVLLCYSIFCSSRFGSSLGYSRGAEWKRQGPY